MEPPAHEPWKELRSEEEMDGGQDMSRLPIVHRGCAISVRGRPYGLKSSCWNDQLKSFRGSGGSGGGAKTDAGTGPNSACCEIFAVGKVSARARGGGTVAAVDPLLEFHVHESDESARPKGGGMIAPAAAAGWDRLDVSLVRFPQWH